MERQAAAAKLDTEEDEHGTGSFLLKGVAAIEREVEERLSSDPDFRSRLETLVAEADNIRLKEEVPQSLLESLWAVFLPEAHGMLDHWEESIQQLRRRRTVEVESLCVDPVTRPAREMLWTSNALLTVPPKEASANDLHLDDRLRRLLEDTEMGPQAYWYDHPVPMGVPPEANEVLYGLRGLSEMLAFEKDRGTAGSKERLQVALSVSVTHPGLHRIARPYIESVLRESDDVHDLDLFIFTEDDTLRLLEEFLLPAAKQLEVEGVDREQLEAVFGVDGPYGRHYNFLKAVSAIWQIAMDPSVKATFKIDLDQIFPQDRLVQELDESAFELLTTPLWGATGRDASGNPVELGMLAGALVNQADIDQGLFTPDVKKPKLPLPLDRWIFATSVPQAVSTVAEMMTRYDGEDLDGKRRCLSRVHVTGGTTGVRIDALRRYRPFTLSPIARAEDQAYIMSVLYERNTSYLRYIHVPGLIMRHDKAGFAAEAIRAAAAGKSVGDYERMVLFSRYAEGLPWAWEDTHSTLAPFTGAFVQRLPFTTSLLAFALKALSMDGEGSQVEDFLSVGKRKLGSLLDKFEKNPDWVAETYVKERAAWNSFYDILGRVEQELERDSAEARELAAKAREIIAETRLRVK
jgi:hypothetical protein